MSTWLIEPLFIGPPRHLDILMDILGLARRRRSVRRFRSDPISEEDLRYVLEAAHYSPSGANRQPWRYILVRDPGRKRRIREICEEVEKRFYERVPQWFLEFARSRGITWRKPHLTDAPVLIVVAGYRKSPHWKESVWIMIGYLLLAAEERGLATLTYTPSDTRWAKEFFGLPDGWGLETIIPIGYPEEVPSFPGRYRLEDLIYSEEWGRRGL